MIIVFKETLKSSFSLLTKILGKTQNEFPLNLDFIYSMSCNIQDIAVQS